LGARKIREPLDDLPILPITHLLTENEMKRGMLLLSMFAHAYIWQGGDVTDTIPPGVAVPLWDLSEKLGIAPVLTHPSIVLTNWRRLDPNGPISLDNLATLHNFLDGCDESWFYLVTVEVEMAGACAVLPAIEVLKISSFSLFISSPSSLFSNHNIIYFLHIY